MTERIGERVDLDEVSLDHARYADEDMQEFLVEYLQKRQSIWQPDLVVPMGSPAGIFVAEYRQRLFPDLPILYAGMDRRRLPTNALSANAAFIGERYDVPGFVDDILQIAPDTTNIVVVIGASPLERFWTEAFRKEWNAYTNRVNFTWLNEFSLDQMLAKMGKLPPKSFIFLILMLRDASGVTHNADEVLRRIRAVANAPVNSIFQSQMGMGVVGGRLYQDEQVGVESARFAIRILHGEAASSLPEKIIETTPPQYDWRELQRWKINEARLPAGSIVNYRQPTLWQRYRALVLAVATVLVVQSVLIVGLITAHLRRRIAERSLRESEERMKLAAAAAELTFWEWEVDANKIWAASPSSPQNGQPSSYDEFMKQVYPDDRDTVTKAVAQSLNTGGDYQSAHRLLTDNGKPRWVSVRGRVEFGPAGKPLRMRGVSLDITARKEAEERARASEREFVLIANSAPVLIWAAAPNKLCTFLNEPWLDFTGRTLEQELGNGWTEGVHPDDMSGCLKVYNESFDARRSFTMEYRLRRYDGQFRWLSDHGVPRYGSEGEFLGYIGSCVDVTERKQAEAEAQHTRQQLAHVGRVSTLGELAGSLAHELSQPLTAILSNAQAGGRFLSATPTDLNEVRSILTDVAGQARHAGDIIGRVRAMLKKGETELLPLDINILVREVLGLLQSELAARKIAVTTRLASGMPLLNGDRIQLQQVLVNLLMNGCDAMGARAGSKSVLTIVTERLDEQHVQVSVSDCGPGFPAEMRARPFEAFRTTKPDGLGLGLLICRSIVLAHGGQIWLSNNPKGGAIVRCALRVAQGAGI